MEEGSWSITYEGEPNMDDLGHIAELIQEGYTSGTFDHEDLDEEAV